ncbi:Aminomethyltransferase (plasmid) [Tsukamurella tyrosinosolvens]|uniref:Aminomethyltransferase n=1 Tax=Tsukamurella tyrosinosolvens TaxID=57704 RepID=A0A1H4XLW7_TSUTY|nr:glycine cleavage system aminomethyltransferase GcvT [Tsukamurella tyrosinosolvens]KXP00489.1 glycine cleavage system protein T [Tsukamurella tyrosinosolvens]SED06669.1 aminomethyltransferase [Tsukamurella tyrosinosolvens]VEH97979.1 Aminomethyltransferase [Tsukamurella tyrosinosolvens]
MSETLIEGPLNAVHTELGAAFAPFGGWSMPVKYAGTVGEHTAVREAVGIFDVSHLGKATVAGPGAKDFVNRVLTADLGKIHPGKAQYTLCTNESGGVIDDLIVYYVSDDELFLVPNAANTAAVVAHLCERAPEGITVTDQHRDYAVLAVQGPKSAEVLQAVGLPTDMEYMAYEDASLNGTPVRVCRTGYTGEHGYELIPAWGDAETVFRALLPEITSRDGQPAGLGARDTLRTEMGYPLHGHELTVDITPVQARAGWAVGWKKPEFVGRDALVAEKEAGPARRLWGLRATGKGVLRADLTVLSADGAPIGTTTSGTFSPSLKAGIALALIDSAAGVEKGTPVSVDVRGRAIECEVTLPPFVEANTK